MTVKSKNPTTGELMLEFPRLTKNQIDEKITKASQAFIEWKNLSFKQRGKYFHALADLMENQLENLARLNTLEMGMLYKDALGDVKKSVQNVRFFADNAEKYLAPKPFDQDGLKGEIVNEPLGVIFSVNPWNYPYNQVLRNAVPNIMAGNVVLMRHASNVPQVAMELQKLFDAAGFPQGVYTNMFLSYDFTEYVISNWNVRGASVTGSERAGKIVGELAGKYLKPSVLELGGSDAFILIDTQDIDKAVAQAVKGRFSNHGQKCNSSKRFIIIESMYEEFCEKFAQAVSKLKVGDPFESETDIGPLAKPGAVFDLHGQVMDSIEAGAKLICGGAPIEGTGNFYAPTVLKDVKPGMRAFDEETFGPVAAVIKAQNVEEIISLTNNSVFGLGASIFGDDMEIKKHIASKLEVQVASIDKIVTSYAFLPYGGIKNTGYGRELGESGLKAFTNEKVVIF